MIGVTLASPAMLSLAVEAVKRWRDQTGLECVMLCPPGDKGAHFYKLRIPDLVRRGPICYFDADWWMIRAADPRKLLVHGCFTAVADCGVNNSQTFAYADVGRLGLNAAHYFNSGFFVCDTRETGVQEAFREAIALSQTARVSDFGEQSHLNAGVQKHLPVNLISNEWNTGPWAWQAKLDAAPCVRPIGLHAFGVPHAPNKLAFLQAGEHILSARHVPDLSSYNCPTGECPGIPDDPPS